jgi:hypothetical protein
VKAFFNFVKDIWNRYSSFEQGCCRSFCFAFVVCFQCFCFCSGFAFAYSELFFSYSLFLSLVCCFWYLYNFKVLEILFGVVFLPALFYFVYFCVSFFVYGNVFYLIPFDTEILFFVFFRRFL